jgi:hypothetical protein
VRYTPRSAWSSASEEQGAIEVILLMVDHTRAKIERQVADGTTSQETAERRHEPWRLTWNLVM